MLNSYCLWGGLCMFKLGEMPVVYTERALFIQEIAGLSDRAQNIAIIRKSSGQGSGKFAIILTQNHCPAVLELSQPCSQFCVFADSEAPGHTIH